MASKAEEATPSLYSDIDIKEEPVLTDSCHQQPMKEFQQIYIKEENIKLEIPDDHYALDPLQLEEEKRGRPKKIRLCDNAGENDVNSVVHKIPKELRNEVQLTDGTSESESIIPATVKECNTCGGSGRLGARDVPPTEFGNATQSTIEEGEVLSSTSQHLEPSSSVCKGTVAHLQDLMEDKHMDSYACSECHIPLPECEVCHRVCRSHAALRVHSAVHTGERPYTCSVCLKQFSRKFNLEVHSRVHTEKELYACVICPKKFTQPYHLKAHLRAHYGRRLHSCRVCNKTFSLRCKQNNHSRTHWGAVISL